MPLSSATIYGWIIGLTLISTPSMAGLFGPDSFDECMVDEMKGQSQTVYGHVYKVCRERFPIKTEPERRVSISEETFQYRWDQTQYSTSQRVSVTSTRNETGYIPTRFVVVLSEKGCQDSGPSDVKHRVELKADVFGLGGSAIVQGANTFGCLWIEQMYGRKKSP